MAGMRDRSTRHRQLNGLEIGGEHARSGKRGRQR
jgi:hypothetical protein